MDYQDDSDSIKNLKPVNVVSNHLLNVMNESTKSNQSSLNLLKTPCKVNKPILPWENKIWPLQITYPVSTAEIWARLGDQTSLVSIFCPFQMNLVHRFQNM